MSYIKDLTGQRFGRLVVLEFVGNDGGGRSKWRCRCDCGNEKIVTGYCLGSHTMSCGCLQKESTSKKFKKHGMRHSRLYYIWCSMKERCYNTSQKRYAIYGGRGITVCEEWKNSFEAFYEWAVKNGYSDDLTLDRKETNGDYCPENCRWATQKEQQNNRRNNIMVEHNGKTQSIAAWAEEIGVEYATLYRRIVIKGMSTEKAMVKRGI